jgi:hypothetical protein
MDKSSNTPAATLDQGEEDILTYTVSDEALEAAAGTERGAVITWAMSHTCAIGC